MSYARFGPDSDVFVYSSVDNTLVVSVSRTQFVAHPDYPLPHKPVSAQLSAAQYEAALASYRQAVGEGSYVPIGGRRDGLNYEVRSPGEAATVLRALQTEGYRVPDSALAALDAQQQQLAARVPAAHVR